MHIVSTAKIISRLLLLMGLALSGALWAQVPDIALFSASVSVESSDVVSTNAGKKDAFERVLVRIAGINDIIDHDSVQAALADPDAYMTSYQFSRKRTAVGIGEQLFIDVSFDAQRVVNLLRGADLPVWSSARPSMLVWALIDDSRELYAVNSATQPEYSAILLDQADHRGLQALLPLMDLTDLAYVNVEEVYTGSSDSVRLAAARYDSDVMLVLRVGQSAQRQWQIRWELWEGDEPQTRFGTAATRASALRLGLDWAADQIASTQLPQKDIGPTARVHREKWIQINRVPDFISYTELVDFFKQVNGIADIHLVRLTDQSMLLSINGDVTWGQLLSVVRLNNKLIELDNSDATVLRLTWRG